MLYQTLYVRWHVETGNLLNESDVPLAPEPGTALRQYQNFDTSGQVWDPTTTEYVPAPVDVVVNDVSYVISKREFLWNRLGPQVLGQALSRESTDGMIAAFRMLIDNTDFIHLDDPATQAGVGYLKQLGLLDDAAVTRILAPVVT